MIIILKIIIINLQIISKHIFRKKNKNIKNDKKYLK
jgi:hypothetical protein